MTRIASPDEKRWAGASAVFFGMAALLLGGCTVGPNYQRPSTDVPADYQESADFKTARPSDEIAKGKWWEVYGDPQLNALEEQVIVSNQTLKEAQAQYAGARAAIIVNRAAYYPTVTAGASAAGNHVSQTTAVFGTTSPVTYADYQLPPIDVSWEPDVWGRVRRSVEAARTEAQASAADLANTQLSLQAELALDYFQLRGLDSQQKLLDSTVTSYE
ncbi:MAG: TolC family protein, partial [Candidatus Acidiferrales bacterium]